MKRFGLVVLVVLMVFVVFGCGEKSGLEGKVVDGKGSPVANVKIIAKQVQPIKGYEQFEATTGSDGKFSFGKLFPTSEYILFPWYEDWTEAPMRTLKYETNKLVARFNKEGWTTEQKMKVQSGPEGQTTLLTSPMVIRPCISTAEGKVIDGKKKPLKGIKIIAKQVKPVPGYEQFEATTSTDGSFRFAKLFPDSKYTLVPSSGDWRTTEEQFKTKGEQETFKLQSIMIRFTMSKAGVVTDSRTGLQWAAKDNGRFIEWQNAKSYCENYTGGGYIDWRMPTQDELAGLYDPKSKGKHGGHLTRLIDISYNCLWASETRGSTAAFFNFYRGKRAWGSQDYAPIGKVLPVRSGK